MSYQYDFFYSYKRHPNTNLWHTLVAKELARVVGENLALGKDATYFLDQVDINTGDLWRNRIAGALKTSKCAVCLLSPNYFQSAFCVAEMNSFIERSLATDRELVVSASCHDGENFPREFLDAWQYAKFQPYMNPSQGFWKTELASEFMGLLSKFAEAISEKIASAPMYSDDFPVNLVMKAVTPIPIPRPSNVI